MWSDDLFECMYKQPKTHIYHMHMVLEFFYIFSFLYGRKLLLFVNDSTLFCSHIEVNAYCLTMSHFENCKIQQNISCLSFFLSPAVELSCRVCIRKPHLCIQLQGSLRRICLDCPLFAEMLWHLNDRMSGLCFLSKNLAWRMIHQI